MARTATAFALIFITFALPQSAWARGLTLGFFDNDFVGSDPSPELSQAQSVGSRVARLMPRWRLVAPRARPAQFDPANPDDPSYDWKTLDADVREAQTHGQEILLTIYDAPAWAQGADRPGGEHGVNWKVDPQAVADFATALARRYSGSHLDASGQHLPRITNWQIWNEPNLYASFNPQWERSKNTWQPYAATHYRAILNAAYGALKAVSRDNRVVTAGTGPFGDPNPGGQRIPPLLFWRYLLCLKPNAGCEAPAHFDVAAHHPYSVRGPTAHAANRDDASVPDVRKIVSLVRTAVRRHLVLPATSKPMWVTELAWDSNPPDPDGVPITQQAEWLSRSVYELWRQGVSLLTWFQVTDSRPVPSFAASYQGGVFFLDGRPKPAAEAFRFPFVVLKQGQRRLAWGIAPTTGPVRIEEQVRGRWKLSRIVTAPSDRVFSVRLRRATTSLRAVQGMVTSPRASQPPGRSKRLAIAGFASLARR
jgi:hypothetical protein